MNDKSTENLNAKTSKIILKRPTNFNAAVNELEGDR